jgi:hypothetical protein
VSSKPARVEWLPIAAVVVSAVFAIEILFLSSANLSAVAAAFFYGIAIVLAGVMQETSLPDASTAVQVAIIVGVLFIVLAFLETVVVTIFRRATPRVRWMIRSTAAVLAVGLLLFTPAAGAMRLF